MKKTQVKINNFISLILCVAMCACVLLASACDVGSKKNSAPSEKDLVTVTADDEFLTVAVGESKRAYATASDGSTIEWASENDDIAYVSSDGTITGAAEGLTVVYAVSGVAYAKIEVTVTKYSLVFEDEFLGDELDYTKWTHMTGVRNEYGSSVGPMFWGNGELQYYDESATKVSEGVLTITATKTPMPNGRGYVSSRISTRNKFKFTYGYVEAKMKLPADSGLWPAFWMLPEPASAENTANRYGGWASSGEIDILESKGRITDFVYTTLHFGNQGESTHIGSASKLSSPISEWHVYALDWSKDKMVWLIDGEPVMEVNSDEWWSQVGADNAFAPFDVDFYILLNLAVGGNFDNGLAPNEQFTYGSMQVDYVRVYQEYSKS
ncbi:MAG: family 16 glycosylhydrolase [Clostridia bacterium]|nr:family 16 glycosylhydrolase [Clostridia bacterium]